MIREIAQFLFRRAWAEIELPGRSGRFMVLGTPDASGNCVIENSIAALRHVSIGDEIVLHVRGRDSIRYRVQQCRTVDHGSVPSMSPSPERILTFTTSGPPRYVVIARACNSVSRRA